MLRDIRANARDESLVKDGHEDFHRPGNTHILSALRSKSTMSTSQNRKEISDELFLPKGSDSTIHNSSTQLPSFSVSKPQKDAELFLDIPSTFSMSLSPSERQCEELFFKYSTGDRCNTQQLAVIIKHETRHEAITKAKTSITPAHRTDTAILPSRMGPRIPTCMPPTQPTLAELEADASVHGVELSNDSIEGAGPTMAREHIERLPLVNAHTTPFAMDFFEMLLKEPALREKLAASLSKL